MTVWSITHPLGKHCFFIQNSLSWLIPVKVRRQGGARMEIRMCILHKTSCQNGVWKMRLSTCVPGLCQQICQGRGDNSNSHIHLQGESGNSFLKARAFVFLCLPASPTLLLFFCFFTSFSSKACRCVAMRKKTGSRPPALVSMERHARKTKTSELCKHHSRKTAARTTHGGGKWATETKTSFLDQGATR